MERSALSKTVIIIAVIAAIIVAFTLYRINVHEHVHDTASQAFLMHPAYFMLA
ncbi:hypothetical protein [Kozakia baliensis]|uniref:hypothetical protein n=1 Tax=Kozakia baliensis TaxID=153496 RepID=UPI00116A7AC4|nr:hypothetical protein [Kozakia baliensis]GBR24164.1 hypothetical protein AA0488_0321 [Kozakia baliensis NRIC 0488]GEL64593.1 hypothetical protein KBA01_18790 [Kozakia baliensis]